MGAIKKILCPTDLSDECRPALAMACEWAKRFGAELHLMHVVAALSNPYPYLGPPFNEAMSWETMIRQKARAALDEWPLPEGFATLKIVRALRSGSPSAHIVQYAQEMGIDLIVMGTHGRSGFSHLLMGSVAENVVRRASCSVLTVPPAARPKLTE
jgi:nucleotide-binding universal stress UspA family protein